MPLSPAPSSTPPLFEFHEGDFPKLIEFIERDITSRTVPPQEVPPPPARILALAKSLRDNRVHASPGEPLYVPIRGCDRAAATSWKGEIKKEVLNWSNLNVFFHVFRPLPKNDFIATDRAKTFITRLEHALQDEIQELIACIPSSFLFPCDPALLNAPGVEDEIATYLEARGDVLGVSVIPRKEESGFKISIQRNEE